MKNIIYFFLLYLQISNLMGQEIKIIHIEDYLNYSTLEKTELSQFAKQIIDNYQTTSDKSFYDNNSKIVFVNKKDHNTIVDLTNKHINQPHHIQWSKKGKIICAVVQDLIYKNQNFIATISMDGIINLIKPEPIEYNLLMPTFSNDDKFIAYVENYNKPSVCRIKIKNLLTNETTIVDDDFAVNPVWFNNSSKLLYKTEHYNYSTQSKNTKINIYDIETKIKSTIFEGIIFMSYPLLSPNDSLIALGTKEGTKILNVRGDTITDLNFKGAGMKWSPDNKYLSCMNGIFDESDRMKSLSLNIINVNDKTITNLTPSGDTKDFSYFWLDDSTIVSE